MLKIKIDKRTFTLFLLVISTFFLSQNYNTAILFAQNESGSVEGVNQNPDGSILVCEFVQFCSDPVEFSGNDNGTAVITPVTPQGEAQTTAEDEAQTTAEDEAQTTAEDEAQTTAEDEAQTTAEGEAQTTAEGEAQTTSDSSDLIPDVTSNISLIMTPDLPDSMTEEDLQNSLSTTGDSQLVVPENATVITPDVQMPSETIDENISMTIQDVNDTVSTESGTNNQSELAEITLLNNTTNSMDGSNMSQSGLVDDTIDSTAANETIDSTAANETIDSTAANETIDSTAANETIDSTAANETIDSTAANETIDSTAANETIDSTAANETIDSTAANETIDSTAANETIDSTAANETIDSTAANETIDSTAANETIDSTAANETIDSTAANETIDSTAANETIDSTAANETNQLDTPPQIENQSGMTNATTTSQATSTIDQQDNTSIINEVQPNPSATTENQTNPTAFLDPIINPFKQLFGLK